MALFPAATQVVVSIDGAKLRASPAAAKLSALATQSEADRKDIDELIHRTGFDPLRQIQSLTLAFPEEARARGELGLILRADHLDETRLVAYVRDSLQKTGDDLVAAPHGRFTLWSTKKDPGLAGFFIDTHTFALGGGGWATRIADLAENPRPGDSAATNLELASLVERAAGSHAIWAVAIVGDAVRRTLAGQPDAVAAAGVRTLSAAIDLGRGLEAVMLADLATPEDARTLAERATSALRDAKRNPQVLMMGLGPYLDGVTAGASDKTLEVHATLGETALDDLLNRLKALATVMRGSGGFPPPAPAK